MANPGSIVVRGKWTLGVHGAAPALLRDHSVFIESGVIAGISMDRPGPGNEVVEVEDGLVLPGFVNLHTHCINGPLFRAIIDDLPRDEWNGTAIYSTLLPIGDLAMAELGDDELEAVVRLGFLELLKGGSTTVLEMFRPEQARAVFAAAKAMGIRAYAAPYVASRWKAGLDRGADAPHYAETHPTEASLSQTVALFHEHDEGERGRIRLTLGPHGTDTCEPELLSAVRATADTLGCPITIHVAQSKPELLEIERRYGKSPVEYLRDVGLLGPDVIAAHCIHATDRDLDILRDTRTAVASCPLVFARGGNAAPFWRFAAHGLRTGIGSDSYCFDYISELRAAGIISKLFAGKSGVATAWDLIRAATSGGAEALGRGDLGWLKEGARADLVVVDLGRPHLQPVRDPIKNLVWNATAADVRVVLVDGTLLVRDGVYLLADEGAITEQASAAVEKVWRRAEDSGLLPSAVLAR